MIKRAMSGTDFPWPRSCCPTRSHGSCMTPARIWPLAAALSLVLSLLLTGCMARRSSPEPRSTVTRENCLLCGGGTDCPWGQDNVGILSLNTFSITPIEINRYDQDGTLVKENTGTLSLLSANEKELDFSLHGALDPDRGMAHMACAFGENAAPDLERATQALCQDCLGLALSGSGVGVIDLSTREFRPLAENCSSFGLGNYYIHCDWDSAKPGAELWVFYVPMRYP